MDDWVRAEDGTLKSVDTCILAIARTLSTRSRSVLYQCLVKVYPSSRINHLQIQLRNQVSYMSGDEEDENQAGQEHNQGQGRGQGQEQRQNDVWIESYLGLLTF